jgi:hypothetical protein
MQTFAIRVGTIVTGVRREADVRTIDRATVDQLTDGELTNALFYAQLGRTDDALVTLLRRETARRLVAKGDVETLQKLVDEIIFEGVGSLFNHSNLWGDESLVSGYDDYGKGISVVARVELHQE